MYNDSMDLKYLENACVRECNLTFGRPVLVGVSGGADSLALSDGLAALGFPVVVAHYDHQLRAESQADQQFVREFAGGRQLTFVSESGDVAGFASEHALSIEEAARRMRYAFLFKAARQHGAQALAVGHTADDQVETVLMHMLRGAGLDGLTGMPWRGYLVSFDADMPLIRPLLGIWRADTEAWCQSHNLNYRVDASNADTTYTRNRLRHEIIPMLERYNPRARTHIQRMAGHLTADQRFLTGLAEAAFRKCLDQEGEGYLVFNRKRLAALDPALGARVMREAAFRLAKDLRDFDSGAVGRCLDAVGQAPDGWQSDLPGGLRLRVSADRLTLMTWQADLPGQDWPRIAQDFQENLACPGELMLGDGWKLRAEPASDWEEALDLALGNTDANQAWLDPGENKCDLVVRRAPAGQRFIPLGMETGSQKLSDFWVNVHLPRAARAAWPVVYCGAELAWLPGFRLAQPFRLTGKSRRVIHLELLHSTSPEPV
jgi:tRNA(Ile)-lysidine synthase